MQIVHREHSSRRQNYQQRQQQLRAQEDGADNNSDVDGAAHRVASVTLESDSLSADQPMSFRNKRRKKIPRKEKQHEMDSKDSGQQDCPEPGHKSCKTEDEKFQRVPCKLRMDWEANSKNLPSTSSSFASPELFPADLENSQSDVLSDSESTSNADADDEQSDWPDSKQSVRSSQNQGNHGNFLQPDPSANDAALSAETLKQILMFLKDDSQTDLILNQVCRTSAIKRVLRREAVPVQIEKKGRGTVALKKL